QFGDLGLSITLVNLFRREVAATLAKSNRLMVSLNDLLAKMQAFVRLLHKGILMAKNTNNSHHSESSAGVDQKSVDELSQHGQMTAPDFHLVMDFLHDNSLSRGFKFENIGSMLKPADEPAPAPEEELRPDEGPSANPHRVYLR